MEKLNNMNTTKTELEGYSADGKPGMMKDGGGMKHHKRAKGGHLPEALKEHDEEEEKKPKRRRSGGKVDGKMPHHRPDKRARGGGVSSDEHPETSAGKMSSLPYENKEAKGGSEGEGDDKE